MRLVPKGPLNTPGGVSAVPSGTSQTCSVNPELSSWAKFNRPCGTELRFFFALEREDRGSLTIALSGHKHAGKGGGTAAPFQVLFATNTAAFTLLTSRKISKLKAISIKLELVHLRYFCLVAA